MKFDTDLIPAETETLALLLHRLTFKQILTALMWVLTRSQPI